MRGPLPKDDASRRRRNAPTISPTELPSAGRRGVLPKVPRGYALRECGSAWWEWAWATPQAAAWNDGYLYAVLRRAVLEDDLDAIRRVDSGSFDELLDSTEDDTRRQIEWVVSTLRAICGSELNLMKEARELDDRLGLTAKSFAQLRWQLADPAVKPAAATPTSRQDRKGLVVHEGGAAAG
jgi:hypothetical protein